MEFSLLLHDGIFFSRAGATHKSTPAAPRGLEAVWQRRWPAKYRAMAVAGADLSVAFCR
jgi:hypothetical protein